MFSQTVEYALRAMMFLATIDGQAANSERIARQTRVPAGYLSKLMRDLVLADLVTSFRGPNGGFMLARLPEKISIYDVVCAVQPLQRIRKCPLGNPQHKTLCALHRRLDDALASIETTFRQTSLAELLLVDEDECCQKKVQLSATLQDAAPLPQPHADDPPAE
jgi:Rrf2 family transcriptional regulator, nitric oxide-sensitive transcriptional repressor